MDRMMLQNKWKYELALSTNSERRQGDIDEAVKGADALIAASKPGPDVLSKSTLRKMNKDAILFALSNPVPEIWPRDAKEAGIRIVATGRSDFPNQVNNSLIFPSVIRGVLDVKSKAVPDDAIIAGAKELAEYAQRHGALSDEHILPTMMDREIYPLVAAAVGDACVKMGISRIQLTRKQIQSRAEEIIQKTQKLIHVLQKSNLIEPTSKVPEEKRRKR